MSAMQPHTRVIYTAPGASARRRFPWGFLLLLLIIGGIAAALVGWEQSYASAIYPGVRIGGVNIGGLTLAQARQRLAPLQHAALDRAIVVTAGAQQWTVTPRRLGLQLNLDDVLRQAYALGREPDPVDRYSTQLDLVLHGRYLSLVGNYDNGMLQAFVQKIAVAAYRPAQSATVSLRDNRASLSAYAQTGQKLDQHAASTLLAGALSDPHQSRVAVPVLSVQASVSEAEGQREVAALQSILSAHIHAHFGNRHWDLGPSVIAPAISLTTVVANGGAATYQHTINQQALQPFVDDLGAQIDQRVRSATIATHGAALSVIPARYGYHLDRSAAVTLLAQAILAGGDQDVALPVALAQPETPTDAAQQAAHRAAVLIRRPLTLTGGGRSWLLSPAQMAAALTFTPRRDPLNGPQLDLRVDPARLAAALGAVNAGVATAPVDARFQIQGDRVALIPSVNGRRVDTAALARLIERHGRALSIAIPTVPVQPQLTTAAARAMGIKDLILSHSTYFPGSSQARLTNIHAAVRHLDGQLIAPGAVFSFDQRIGDITPQGGYVQGINIIDNQDVPGIGGGVCQVAVTLFQAAIYSGMEILERIPHANIVSYYNPVGMDATVYVAPGGPDVKFKNNTGHWVLIDFVEDLSNYTLTVRFFGTNPHFHVVIRGPYAKYQKNGDVDAVFYRTVYDATGKVLLDAHFNSHYVPASAG